MIVLIGVLQDGMKVASSDQRVQMHQNILHTVSHKLPVPSFTHLFLLLPTPSFSPLFLSVLLLFVLCSALLG